MRSRKPVNYSFEKLEDEDANDSFELRNRTSLCEEPMEENLSYIHGACVDAPTDFGRGKESHMINSPLNENLPGDYIESESWFCTDAGETSHPGTGNRDITSNADTSDDYRKMGGGFCLDDNDIPNNQNAVDGVNTATVDNTEDFPHCSVMLDESDRDKNSSDILFSGTEKADNEMQEGGTTCKVNNEPSDDLLNASTSYDQSEMGVSVPENFNHKSYNGAFSAMPFLRKRRKKN